MENAARLMGGPSGYPEIASPSPALVRLRLVNFRSYSDALLETASGPVVLAGANGTGKTNCLEAISLLSPGRGLRGARLNDIQRKAPHDAEEYRGYGEFALGMSLWAVAGTLSRSDGSWEIGTGLTPPAAGTSARRATHLNGAPAQSTDFAGLAPMLWLTPVQDRLFLEGASGRRRFLDRLVFGLDPNHARRAAGYERAMRERLRLLKDGGGDQVWLDGLEETMATDGMALSEARARLCVDLNAELAARDAAGAFPCAHLTLEDGLDGACNGPELRARLEASRRRDAEAARSTVGPHLANLTVRHTGRRADARECSTGEQKALLISMLLANAWLQKRRNGGAGPMLLLDEIAAHLDSTRRTALFAEIVELSLQAWMTGTDKSLFAPLKTRATFLAVERGQFVEQT